MSAAPPRVDPAPDLSSLRIGFAGTPPFAAAALAALIDAGATIPLVLTQPDRPKGRGLDLVASPVKALADAHGLAVAQPPSLRQDAAVDAVARARLDVLVVAAYGLILPQRVLDLPRHGCVNIHASLLPRWRGAAPVARALEAGDAETGVTLMQMDAGLDTGGMIVARRLAIGPRDSAGTLTERLAALGAQALVEALARLASGEALRATPQPAEGVTYAAKLSRDDARVDWSRDAAHLERAIRAFDPWPGAWTALGGAPLKLWRAEAVEDAVPSADPPRAAAAVPGTVLAVSPQGLEVACGRGVLRLLEVQPASARRMGAAAFAAGQRLVPGARLGAAD